MFFERSEQKGKLKLVENAWKKSKDEVIELNVNVTKLTATNVKNEAKIIKLEKELEKFKSANQNLVEKLKETNQQLKESNLLLKESKETKEIKEIKGDIQASKRSRMRSGNSAADGDETENTQPNIPKTLGY